MESQKPEIETPTSVQIYPLGDAAVVLHFGDAIDLAVHYRIQAVEAYLREHPFPGLLEQVPAFTTLTLYYDPWIASQGGELDPYDTVVQQVRAKLQELPPQQAPPVPVVVEVPVCYGGSFGPDLDRVARYLGLSVSEVVALHTQPAYQVYMMGFVPGFPYLGGLDARLATPRKDVPRPRVPAGSVGIAGAQTGVYPLDTPGGWQLIGRTPLRLFDPRREEPSLLQAGNQVRFFAITPEEYQQLHAHEY